jgi:hypothetical protein
MPRVRARRVVSTLKRGSSWPVVVETDSGRFVTKLRGAAQGVPALIAEVIAAELATIAGLPVPERVIVELEWPMPSDLRVDEFLDLLSRSPGENLGFRWLEGARELTPKELAAVPDEFAGALLWFDALVSNYDRSASNPNLLWWKGQPWLIDHGATLTFQYDWAGISEATPREPFALDAHVFAERRALLLAADAALSPRFDRARLERAVGVVPESWLCDAFPNEDPARVRASYHAFLWKRLKAPRPFVPGSQ